MALDKDVLGKALYNRAKDLNDVDIPPDNLEDARRDFWKAIAEEVINHFKTNGVIKITGVGLVAGPNQVTGLNISKIE